MIGQKGWVPALRPLTVLAITAGLAGGLTACGGDDDDDPGPSTTGQGGNADAAVKDAIVKQDEIRSGQVKATVSASFAAGDQGRRFRLTEDARFNDRTIEKLPNTVVDLKLENPPQATQNVGIIFDGTDLYAKQGTPGFEKQPARLSQQAQQEYARLDRQGEVPLMSITPSDWFRDAEDRGETTAGGEKVRRYIATLDEQTFLRELRANTGRRVGLSFRLTGDARRIETGGEGVDVKARTIEFLVGEDGILRGMLAKLEASVSEDGGSGNVSMELRADLSGLGEPQTIPTP